MLRQLFKRSAGRLLYSTHFTPRVEPTPQVPDAAAFLARIGRGMDQHAEHFETWESLMNAKGSVLKNKGIDTRDRRYILSWVEKYKQSIDPVELKRGTKKWGGARNRRANRAAFYGRKAAEEREKESV